jgi:hypothetical protein
MSYHAGEGTVMDAEHKDMWVKHIADVRQRLEHKYKLPEGWFYNGDIAEYRRLVEDLPNGSTMGELGCYKGRSLCSVADIIKRKKLKVMVVDIFTGTENEIKETNYRHEFEENIKRFGIYDQVMIHEGTTNDVVKKIGPQTFDLLFIDADHSYDAVVTDIVNWVQRMKPGGTISGHDYGNHPGVSKAVNEFFDNVRVNDIKFGIPSGVADGSVWSKRL